MLIDLVNLPVEIYILLTLEISFSNIPYCL